jgi:hypothetical protein
MFMYDELFCTYKYYTCEHATCHQTIGQMFNLHNCNLVEIATIILDGVMPNQWMRFTH